MWMGGLLGSFRLKQGFKCHLTYGTVFLEHVGCSGENDQIDLPFLSSPVPLLICFFNYLKELAIQGSKAS